MVDITAEVFMKCIFVIRKDTDPLCFDDSGKLIKSILKCKNWIDSMRIKSIEGGFRIEINNNSSVGAGYYALCFETIIKIINNGHTYSGKEPKYSEQEIYEIKNNEAYKRECEYWSSGDHERFAIIFGLPQGIMVMHKDGMVCPVCNYTEKLHVPEELSKYI